MCGEHLHRHLEISHLPSSYLRPTCTYHIITAYLPFSPLPPSLPPTVPSFAHHKTILSNPSHINPLLILSSLFSILAHIHKPAVKQKILLLFTQSEQLSKMTRCDFDTRMDEGFGVCLRDGMRRGDGGCRGWGGWSMMAEE